VPRLACKLRFILLQILSGLLWKDGLLFFCLPLCKALSANLLVEHSEITVRSGLYPYTKRSVHLHFRLSCASDNVLYGSLFDNDNQNKEGNSVFGQT